MTHTQIPDIQSSHDPRNMVIARVGIKDVRFPMMMDLGAGAQATIGHYQLTVKLPADQKGTHMSRFISLLEEHTEAFSLSRFQAITVDMLTRLEAEEGDIIVHFPYFIKKTAPVSGIQSMCSKQISDYGAHNQRSHVTAHMDLAAEALNDFDLHHLIREVEQQGSCDLYGLLKRPDEKYVTERAYDNPKFVEDLVRDVAGVLRAQKGVSAFTVEAENFESIHNHSAYAYIDSKDL